MADAPIPANTTGEYETFELLVSEKDAAGYRVTIIEAPAGEANAICRLDPADAEFQDVLLLLEDDNVDAAFLAEFGGYLFDELFGGDIAALYRASLSMVRGQEKRLRVRLRLEPPELAALPWEYLYDPQEDSFLATSPETALVRYIPMRLPSRATAVNLPLRVLVVISNPRDVTPLDVKQEQEIIQQALQERIDHQEIDLRFLERATIAEIAEMMRGFNPHVFHFIGHGQFQGDRAYVVLVDEHDRALRVEERAFREFFQGTPDTRLAIFNACQTGTVSSTQPLVGLAPRLLQRKLSAVVAMQYPIPDTAALIFAREFYRSLAQGYPVDAAVSEARKGIFLETGGGGAIGARRCCSYALKTGDYLR